jgi:hypothetical protein
MSAAPMEDLELRAEEQRERIHKTALELISKVDHAKQQLTAEHIVQRYFAPISAAASALGFLLGYAVTSAFTQDSAGRR